MQSDPDRWVGAVRLEKVRGIYETLRLPSFDICLKTPLGWDKMSKNRRAKENAEAGEDMFGACYNTGHANITGRNFYEDICTPGERLMCLHIHDNDGLHDRHLIPYTQKQPLGDKPDTDWNGLWDGMPSAVWKRNKIFIYIWREL